MNNVTMDAPPQPVVDPDNAGFWRATSRGELAICRCRECRLWIHPALERCRKCGSSTAFEAVSGRGRLFSYIIVQHPAIVGFEHEVPYAVGLVELEEQKGLRLIGRLMDVDYAEIRMGAPYVAQVRPHPGGEFMVPVFVPGMDQEGGIKVSDG